MRLRTILSVFLFSFCISLFARAEVKGAVVLLPGTLNSVLPGDIRLNPLSQELIRSPYFSKDIVQSISRLGFEVFVVKKLDPFGQFEANGERSFRQVNDWYKARFPKRDVPITLLGHSAGGLYALYLATRNSELPIQNILLVSTPLSGVGLADRFLGSDQSSTILRKALQAIPLWLLDTRGLTELTAGSVSRFLQKVRLPLGVRLFSVAGSEERPHSIWEAYDARFLNPVFAVTAQFSTGETDGLVEVDSSYGRGAVIRDQLNQPMPIKPLLRVFFQLDHAKQILDYRIFQLLGIRHADWIRETQIQAYQQMILQTIQ